MVPLLGIRHSKWHQLIVFEGDILSVMYKIHDLEQVTQCLRASVPHL